MTSIITLSKRWQNIDIFKPNMRLLSNLMACDKLNLYSCSCIIEFIKLVGEKSLTFNLFSATCLIKSIKHEHSCKILYILYIMTSASRQRVSLACASA